MPNHRSCDPAQLVLLLSDECDECSLPVELVDHLTSCRACRNELERLAADRWWWLDGRQLLRSSGELAIGEAPTSLFSVVEEQPARPEKLYLGFLDPPAHPELLGRLGKYEIERVIGTGGMGLVLKGFDTQLNRSVAIKVLSPHLASNGVARQRFAREARAAAAVVHDHVVAIYGIETDTELPYLVMPLVSGQSLQRYVEAQGPLEVKDIIRIAMQIAAGLAAAHEQGLVHRDIKPANVLLQDGLSRVLITDFGLARASDDASLTRTGLVAGTPHYMSPEQANGAPVDGRSDLFSLGSVMYFMATGRPPFRADSAMAVLNHICHQGALPLRELNADIPQPLAAVVGRLLEKNKKDRFSSASDVRKTLASYLAFLQDPSCQVLPPGVVERPRSSRRGRLVVAALVLALVAATGGIFSMLSDRRDDDSQGDRPSRLAADTQRSQTEADFVAQALGGETELDFELAAFASELDALRETLASRDWGRAEQRDANWQELVARLERASQSLAPAVLGGARLTTPSGNSAATAEWREEADRLERELEAIAAAMRSSEPW